jgi:hypothetical protein
MRLHDEGLSPNGTNKEPTVCFYGQMEPNAPPFSAPLLTSLAKRGNSKNYDFQLQEKRWCWGLTPRFLWSSLRGTPET